MILALTLATLLAACGGSNEIKDSGVAVDAYIPPPDPVALCAAGADAGIVYAPLDVPVTGNLRHDVSIAVAANVIVPTLRELEVKLIALVCATLASADAPLDADKTLAAQDAWRDVMHVMQRANLMEIGPAAIAMSPGGMGVSDELYAWPLINRCKVDETIVSKEYETLETVASFSPNVRGLLTMEYLLFPPAGNACPETSPLNMFNQWLLVNDLPARRARYAHNAALVALDQATRLRFAWEPTHGNFLASVNAPGEGASPYADVQQLLNALSDAIFYLYSDTRDLKVAYPAGINTLDGTRPLSVESLHAGASLAHIRDNIVAFREVFTGGAPGTTNLGFDDLLASVGQTALSDDILVKIDVALAAADAVPGPLETAVNTHPTEVYALYEALKAISDILKSQFISVLGLQAPASAAGDND